jgi:hypothetical protein
MTTTGTVPMMSARKTASSSWPEQAEIERRVTQAREPVGIDRNRGAVLLMKGGCS